jgi:hypothetical protein
MAAFVLPWQRNQARFSMPAAIIARADEVIE